MIKQEGQHNSYPRPAADARPPPRSSSARARRRAWQPGFSAPQGKTSDVSSLVAPTANSGPGWPRWPATDGRDGEGRRARHQMP